MNKLVNRLIYDVPEKKPDKINKNANIRKNKYLVLIFSDNKGKPSLTYKPRGYGGLRHNEFGYLQNLSLVAKYLNRKVVFSPPHISLEKRHNLNKPIDKHIDWDVYFNLANVTHLERNPPFSFSSNGDIISHSSIEYYPSNTNINKIDNSVDIVALVNYNSNDGKLKTHSEIIVQHEKGRSFYNYVKYPISNHLKKYANLILKKMNLNDYVFIHIRRTDFLYNKILAPPYGSQVYTTPEFISTFVKKYIKNKTIFISTDERDSKYKEKINELLNDYTIIFEDKIMSHLPEEIINDNYQIYLILDEISRNARVNIGTTGYVRLGDKYDYYLSDYQ